MQAQEVLSHQEKVVKLSPGLPALLAFIVLLFADIAAFVLCARQVNTQPLYGWGMGAAVLGFCALLVCLNGFFILQPNEARVLVLFGNYKGTVRKSGFFWGNPFYANGRISAAPAQALADSAAARPTLALQRTPGRNKISLRIRTLNTPTLKVNDKSGNPIDIAAVVVWRVEDTAQATFDVDDYEKYVAT
jgi:regulator of protease activity HflC (stomatin/prohibitin superfamily)